jgi:hypothetical protein
MTKDLRENTPEELSGSRRLPSIQSVDKHFATEQEEHIRKKESRSVQDVENNG